MFLRPLSCILRHTHLLLCHHTFNGEPHPLSDVTLQPSRVARELPPHWQPTCARAPGLARCSSALGPGTCLCANYCRTLIALPDSGFRRTSVASLIRGRPTAGRLGDGGTAAVVRSLVCVLCLGKKAELKRSSIEEHIQNT